MIAKAHLGGMLPGAPFAAHGAPAEASRRHRAPEPGTFAGELRRMRASASPAGRVPNGWAPSGVGEISPGHLPEGPQALVWAARELEAQLWAWLLKEALKSSDGAGPFGRGFPASVYQEWLAQSVAELVVQSGPAALSEPLVEQLTTPGGR